MWKSEDKWCVNALKLMGFNHKKLKCELDCMLLHHLKSIFICQL